ncbi:hypothetical protein T484DRAFT_1808461 [Baffinella frigidus]|nr:hypothetical protein T484DRAFT_1808461 [Cryptophyta sp. CCMP2293]
MEGVLVSYAFLHAGFVSGVCSVLHPVPPIQRLPVFLRKAYFLAGGNRGPAEGVWSVFPLMVVAVAAWAALNFQNDSLTAQLLNASNLFFAAPLLSGVVMFMTGESPELHPTLSLLSYKNLTDTQSLPGSDATLSLLR